MITGVEGESESCQVAELRFVVFLSAVGMLMEVIAQTQVGKGLLHVFERLVAELVIHADHELMLEPAAGVEVAVELVDLLHSFFRAVDQADEFHIGRQDVAIFLQLMVNEVQRALPEFAAGSVQQYHGHQRAFASLDQCQHFQRFIQGTETARAQDQRIGFLDEKQLAG